ncbi:MAG: hypothetical protein HRT35_05635 [Algicola sp.]|nr:hypothetical protein [Algicola sp.]
MNNINSELSTVLNSLVRVIEQESDLTEHAHCQLDKLGGEIVLLEDVVESSQKRRLAKEIMNKVLELI